MAEYLRMGWDLVKEMYAIWLAMKYRTIKLSENNQGAAHMPNIRLPKEHIFFFLLQALFFCLPGEVMALQVHGEPEGLYVHQMAHLFYVLALGYFFWDIRRTAFIGRGWRYLQLYCILMALWNLLAFGGHAAGVYLAPELLYQTDCYLQTKLLGPFDLNKFLYFIAKLDHVICAPALGFLFIGMRSFYQSVAKQLDGASQ